MTPGEQSPDVAGPHAPRVSLTRQRAGTRVPEGIPDSGGRGVRGVSARRNRIAEVGERRLDRVKQVYGETRVSVASDLTSVPHGAGGKGRREAGT